MDKLKLMFKENWKSIIFSYSLFSINSILMLIYPKILGNTIDHLIAKDYSYIWYMVGSFILIMFFGYISRIYDIKIFSGIYRKFASVETHKQFEAGIETTKINGRLTLMNNIVRFFEVDMIVVDSISALLPAIYFEKDGSDLKDLQDTKQIGAEAKDMTHAVKMLNYANKNTLLVLISQQRNQFGSMHASHIPTGGMAVKFFSSTVIKLWSSEAEANAIKAGIKVGDKIIEQRVGRPVNWIIDYNKVGPPNLSGQYDFYYQGETLGVDAIGETLDVAEMCGIVEKGGAWYTVNGERFQGRAKAVQYLRENSKVVEKLQEDIRAKS